MTQIQLDKLILRKKFLIPTRSSLLHELILTQIIKQEPLIANQNVKNSYYNYTRNGYFRWDYPTLLLVNLLIGKGLNQTENSRKFSEEELIGYYLKSVKIATPYELLYAVMGETVAGCSCQIACYPLIYPLVDEKLLSECSEETIQNVLICNDNYLTDLFVNRLDGNKISDNN